MKRYLYRCRRCAVTFLSNGGIDEPATTPGLASAVGVLAGLCPAATTIPLTVTTHGCEGRGGGVADLVGLSAEE